MHVRALNEAARMRLAATTAFLKKHRTASIIGALVLLGLVWALFLRNGEAPQETAVVSRKDIAREVSATGKVKPATSVGLSFDQGGRVAGVYVKEGDKVAAGALLAREDSGTLFADVNQALAKLHAEEAAYDELLRGTRTEEIAVEEREMSNAARDLRILVEDAYTKSDDAIRSKADKLFTSPGGYSPRLAFPISDGALMARVENDRVAVTQTLASWKKDLDSLPSSESALKLSDISRKNLQTIRDFLDQLTLALSFAITSASMTQATIDGYRADVSSARTEVSTALSAFESAASSLALAQSQLTLTKSPATPEALRKQRAKVEDARAAVASARASAAKAEIRAPIAGVITDVSVKAGESATANGSVISLQSSGAFEVEAFIPETNIAVVKPGASTTITLDAYDDVEWNAKIVTVNPAETVVESVSTYKTIFQFAENDERIRSGMTANITITAEEKKGVLSLPMRFVKEREGEKFVLIKNPDGDSVTEKTVTTGISGSEGEVEIVSGLNEGEVAVLGE